jgi:hypothetical protein
VPIQTDVFHPDRMVVAIGRGDVTLQEYGEFVRGILQQGLMHYRKIIDVTRAESSALNPDVLLNFEAPLREMGNNHRGPLAIVVPGDRFEGARHFKAMTSEDRPIEVFRSIHEARGWVMSRPAGEPRPKPQPAEPKTEDEARKE